MNIIVLIIDSYDLEVYNQLRELWKQYMNIHSSIKCYFLYGNEHLETEVKEEPNSLTVHIKDSLQPGIYEKTSIALQYLLNKYPNTDYYIRTNISSFWVWDLLVEFLKSKPTQHYISSPNKDFPAGCGMIMSKDIAKLWADNYNSKYKYMYLDDVAFGHVLMNNNTVISSGFRYDIYDRFYETIIIDQEFYMNSSENISNLIYTIIDNIPEHMYHMRLKLTFDYFRTNCEPICMKYLIKKHYLISE